MTKTELLALADIVDPLVTECESYEGKIKAAAALREYAGMLDVEPSEFCCESAWRDAKALAWKQRDSNCGCDHNEYCSKCFPLDFRKGGKWDKYTHPPAPTTQEPVAWLAAYVNSVGLPDHYVTTHHELAVENDTNGAPKPLFSHPPAPSVPLTDEARNVLRFFAGIDLATHDLPSNFAWYVLEARTVLAAQINARSEK